MKLDGSAVLSADPDKVWSVITDPAVLARTIPGCLSLEQVGDDSYTMTVSVGVGAIRGKYAGEVRLADQQRPTSYVMHASGSGGPGSVRATVTITMAPSDEGTALTYAADAVVGGAVAGVGQRMIAGVAKRMAGQFFTAIDAELTGAPVATVSPISAGVPAGTPAERTFIAPATTGSSLTDARAVLAGAAGGGLIALLGVWIGYLLGRRR